jgi:hypothetical protein
MSVCLKLVPGRNEIRILLSPKYKQCQSSSMLLGVG